VPDRRAESGVARGIEGDPEITRMVDDLVEDDGDDLSRANRGDPVRSQAAAQAARTHLHRVAIARSRRFESNVRRGRKGEKQRRCDEQRLWSAQHVSEATPAPRFLPSSPRFRANSKGESGMGTPMKKANGGLRPPNESQSF